MASTVFDLNDFRPGLRMPNGITFPQLYRAQGYEFDLVEKEDASAIALRDGIVVEYVQGTLAKSDRAAPLKYVLDMAVDLGLADTKFTPMKKLDPLVDTGWVIIRHHMQTSILEGYFDALTDILMIRSTHAYRTREGLFTVLRMKPPHGAPDHLLIYVSKSQIQRGLGAGEWVDRWHIVHPDGRVSCDIADVCPQAFEDEDEF